MISAKKIIIADDHPLFRDALRQAVQSGFGDVEIITCGTFATLQRAIESHDNSDLILLDLQMPGAVGFSALRYLGLRCPNVPIAIVSAHEDASVVKKAIQHGASGFIAKSSPLAELVTAVQDILQGDVVLPKGIDLSYESTEESAPTNFGKQIESLTPKQFRVLMMLIDGRINREIADELCVAEATVKAHLTEIFRKLGVSNRTQAATQSSSYLELETSSLTGL